MNRIRNIKATGFKLSEKQKIITYEYAGMEIVEMCELPSGILIGRKQREKVLTGQSNPWDWVYGTPQDEDNSNPVFLRKDTNTQWQWIVKNIPFPVEFYEIIVDEDKNQIVIKTTNRKYYKIIKPPISDFVFSKSQLMWAWTNNTLIIRYPMPQEVIDEEKEDRKWRLSVPLVDKESDCKI